ncbi:MAG TPA: hypothetical protein VGT79_05450 [Xanthomonadaceae bacterium]|nr:hypothetical protein [Xanthomonadaceae bacterium]
MKFAKRLFFIAAIYGSVGLIPQYFMEAKNGRDYPPAITHPEYYYGFIGVALAWQVLFFLIARDPVRYRLAMLPGALEKIGFGAAGVVLYLQGRVATQMLAFGSVDLVFAVLFLIAFRKTPSVAV